MRRMKNLMNNVPNSQLLNVQPSLPGEAPALPKSMTVPSSIEHRLHTLHLAINHAARRPHPWLHNADHGHGQSSHCYGPTQPSARISLEQLCIPTSCPLQPLMMCSSSAGVLFLVRNPTAPLRSRGKPIFYPFKNTVSGPIKRFPASPSPCRRLNLVQRP